MPVQVTNYQCPACTGPLRFEASTGRLECAYCSSVFTNEEIEALYAEKDAQAAEARLKAEEKEAAEKARAAAEMEQAKAEGWDASAMEDWLFEADGINVYTCPSCGAELICDETTAATACPYCDNPTIVPHQLSGVAKPDFVIPFKLKKEDAIAALKAHYQDRPFLPKVFKDENHLEEIKGVYVPFWLFDGVAEGSAFYEGTSTRVFITGDLQVAETSHYDVSRTGNIEFSRIPVDASKKMDNDYMDSLEPYDYSEMKPFSTAYLPGFFADKYDESFEECGGRVYARAEQTLRESLASTVVGYEGVNQLSCNVSVRDGSVKYALLPVWLLNTNWNGQRFTFAMNGQTGKFVGNLPTDKALRRSKWLKIYGISFAVCLVIALVLGLADMLSVLGG